MNYKAKNWKINLSGKSVVNIAIIVVICYFIFHLFYGDRGVFAYFKLNAELDNQRKKLEDVKVKRLEIENKTKLLRDDSIDQDMLEEQVKNVLGMSKTNERIVKIED